MDEDERRTADAAALDVAMDEVGKLQGRVWELERERDRWREKFQALAARVADLIVEAARRRGITSPPGESN